MLIGSYQILYGDEAADLVNTFKIELEKWQRASLEEEISLYVNTEKPIFTFYSSPKIYQSQATLLKNAYEDERQDKLKRIIWGKRLFSVYFISKILVDTYGVRLAYSTDENYIEKHLGPVPRLKKELEQSQQQVKPSQAITQAIIQSGSTDIKRALFTLYFNACEKYIFVRITDDRPDTFSRYLEIANSSARAYLLFNPEVLQTILNDNTNILSIVLSTLAKTVPSEINEELKKEFNTVKDQIEKLMGESSIPDIADKLIAIENALSKPSASEQPQPAVTLTPTQAQEQLIDLSDTLSRLATKVTPQEPPQP
jgi:hypothetical protein